MIAIVMSAIMTIGVGLIVSVFTYFINKWLDRHFGK